VDVLLVVINGYCISGDWWMLSWWLLMVIVLVVIGGCSLGGY